MKSFARKIVAIIALACVIGAVYFVYMAFSEDKPFIEEKKSANTVREQYIENSGAAEPVNRQIDFAGLMKINSDIIGWIYIPGTNIDYPICKGEVSFYLNHGFDRTYSELGSIFVSSEVNSEFKDIHTLIYGHYVSRDQLFGELSNYEGKSYYDQHKRIYIYMPDKTLAFDIYGVQRISSTGTIYNETFTEASKEYEDWLKESIDNSLYSTGLIPTSKDQTITLSTCSSDWSSSERFVVNGLLTNSAK